MEIERKWLVKEIPTHIEPADHAAIAQAYVVTAPIEVRIRKRPGTTWPCKITFKTKGTLCRQEVESEIPEDVYDKLADIIAKPPVCKDYYTFLVDDHKIEISNVDNTFIYAEVEFKSVEEANAYEFPFPDIVIKEVTEDPKYKMANYWERTRFNSER